MLAALLSSLLVAFGMADEPAAYLRFDSSNQPYVEAALPSVPSRVTVFEDGEVVASIEVTSTPAVIRLGSIPTKDLSLVSAPASGPSTLLSVKQELTVGATASPDCSGFSVNVEVAGETMGDAYARERLAQLYKAAGRLDATGEFIEVAREDSNTSTRVTLTGKPRLVANTVEDAVSSGGFSVCLPVKRLPKGVMDVKVALTGAAPELRGPFLLADVDGLLPHKAPTVFSGSDDSPGDHSVEDNLDLGLLGTSNLIDDGSGGGRTRTNRATMDLRLAPILNWRPKLGKLGHTRTLHYVTPIVLDARLSTGDLTKESAATNTIAATFEYEARKFPKAKDGATTKTSRFPTFNRYILKGGHTSDRSFERAEVKAIAEWRPVVGAWNHPKGTLNDVIPHVLDPDPTRPPFTSVTETGWEIQPVVGAEGGHTYKWENAPAGIERDPDFLRAYVGVSATLDPADWLRIRINETAYLRSETAADRLRNYLNVSIELPVGPVLNQGAQSVFIGYEKGALPPFEKAEVDTIRIGYRIQMAGWFGRYR